MKSLSAHQVGELVREIAPLLLGLFVREVQPHPPKDVLLVLEPAPSDPGEAQGSIRRLRLSASPEGARLHLQIGPLERHTGPIGPFYRALSAELAGARLRGLSQFAGDRVVRLELLGASGPPRALVLELFGRQANLVLCDAGARVLARITSPAEGSRAAERLAVGALWRPPGDGGGPRDRTTVSLLEEVAEPEEPPEHVRSLAALAPLSWRVESTLGRIAEGRHDERRRRDLGDRLVRRLRAARDRLAGLAEQERATGEAERLRRDAELLTAHLGLVRRGMSSIELPDAFEPDSPPRAIALDPGLSPRRNVERLIARSRKLLRSREKLPAELEVARRQVSGLEEWIERVRGSEDPEELEREAVAGGWLPARQSAPSRKKQEPRLPFHRFYGRKGGEIRVGRNARDNDELTFRHARGNDLWLHTSGAPGSHVILVLERGAEPDPEEVLDAAHLAIHFSPLEGASKAGVHVARRKEVSKPRRAPAGLVTLSGGKERMVRVEPARLERLLATRGKPRPGVPSDSEVGGG